MKNILPVYELEIGDDENVGVNCISIVDRPAIEKGWQMFSNQLDKNTNLHFKVANKERRTISGAAMVANLPIYRKDNIKGEYFVIFKPETIRKIAERYFKNRFTSNVNMNHSETMEGIYVFESFIIDNSRGIKAPIGYDNLPDGSWYVSMKVEDETIWNNYIKTGVVTGFSVEGTFVETHLGDAEDEAIKKVIEILAK